MRRFSENKKTEESVIRRRYLTRRRFRLLEVFETMHAIMLENRVFTRGSKLLTLVRGR